MPTPMRPLLTRRCASILVDFKWDEKEVSKGGLGVEAVQEMEQKIKEMEQLKDNTWMDCQYLIEANDSLYECRYALQYTCAP